MQVWPVSALCPPWCLSETARSGPCWILLGVLLEVLLGPDGRLLAAVSALLLGLLLFRCKALLIGPSAFYLLPFFFPSMKGLGIHIKRP